MNSQQILLLLLATLASCTYTNIEPEKKGFNPVTESQQWRLIQMTGNIANVPPTTGSNMAWQEWYVLNPDYKFTKTCVRDNATTSANGSYAVVMLSDGQYLELTYPSKNELIENCSAEPKEFLKINSEDGLSGTWSMCDGPGLLYQKVR